MNKGPVILSYRKIIDRHHQGLWEQLVWQAAFEEFKLQAQFYNQEQKFSTYGELLKHVKGAEKLPFLVSGAILNYLTQLQEKIPDIIDNQGRTFLSFKKFNFEILTAHVSDNERFKIAINFFSEPVIWYDTIGHFLLVGNHALSADNSYETHLIAIQPYLNIHEIKHERLEEYR